MRALIVASVSRDTVTAPSRTWATNSFTKSLPRSRAAVSRVKRPCAMIWSSKPCSLFSTTTGAAARFSATLLIGASFRLLQIQLSPKLLEFFSIGNGLQQQFVELIVALQASAQVRQLRSQFEQLTQWLDLTCHLLGFEIFQALEAQVDSQVRGVLLSCQLALNRKVQGRDH